MQVRSFFSNSHPTARACVRLSSHLLLPEWESANFILSPLLTSIVYVPQPSIDRAGGGTPERGGQPLQPAKVDSSGKWHLWLWVVSDKEEQLGVRERGAEKEREREREREREGSRERAREREGERERVRERQRERERERAWGLLGKDWDRLSF